MKIITIGKFICVSVAKFKYVKYDSKKDKEKKNFPNL
jgi:hypothetical protein